MELKRRLWSQRVFGYTLRDCPRTWMAKIIAVRMWRYWFPTFVREREEQALYKADSWHCYITTLLEQDLFYRLYVKSAYSYTDKHKNPEDEPWFSGQSANTVMVGSYRSPPRPSMNVPSVTFPVPDGEGLRAFWRIPLLFWFLLCPHIRPRLSQVHMPTYSSKT